MHKKPPTTPLKQLRLNHRTFLMGHKKKSKGLQRPHHQRKMLCLSLKAAIVSSFPSLLYHREQPQLTAITVNRKRGRVDSSPEAQETPTVKRRALRPPGTTSLSRRLFPLSRRLSTTNVSYTERLRRRAAERKGRIHTTVFRLPELVAQTEADRQVEEAEPSSPCPPAPQSAMDFSGSPDSRNIDQPSTSQEPQTPSRGWNIRGLINSVPRTFSRFLPRLGRSPDRTQESGMSLQTIFYSDSCLLTQIQLKQIYRLHHDLVQRLHLLHRPRPPGPQGRVPKTS